jgi:probable phosphoglycerate mutase
MKLPTLYLLRHGQTEWNAAGRFQGQMNSDLTDVGKGHAAAQGRLLGPVFKQLPDIDVYGSPLGRVRDTAKIALADHGRQPALRDDLMEITVGDWEGILKQEIEAGWPDLFNASQTSTELSLSSPNGENYDDMHDRCYRFLNSLSGPSVIFSHGITITFLRKIACDLSYEAFTQLSNLQGCIYEIKDGQETLLTESE